DGLGERVAIAGAGGRTDHSALMNDRFAAMEGRKALDGEGDELAGHTFRLDLLQRLMADEAALVERDAEAEPRLIRVVVGADVARPIEIALLHPAGIDGAIARIGDAVLLPCLPEHIVDMAGINVRNVELVALLADIADAHRI